MTVLLTGAHGFLGKYLLATFVREGHRVVAICRGPHPDDQGMVQNGQVKYVYADIRNPVVMPHDFDVVVHAAGRTPAEPRPVSLEEYVESNVIGTQNVINCAVARSTRLFIYVSAVSVYGAVSSPHIDEETPVNPDSSYGFTKYAGECLVKHASNQMPSIMIRIPLIVGKGMRSGWLYQILEKFRTGETVTIYNGSSPYNFLEADDFCSLIARCLSLKQKGCDLYTLSSKDLLTVREVAEIVQQHAGSRTIIQEKSSPVVGFTLSYEKAKNVLGFEPKGARAVLDRFLKGH